MRFIKPQGDTCIKMNNQILYQFKNILRFMKVKKNRYLKAAPGSILFLLIWITNKCNLRCKMCDQWYCILSFDYAQDGSKDGELVEPFVICNFCI